MYEAARPLPRLMRTALLAVMASALGAGCFASHGRGGPGEPPPPAGERCGPTTCASGEVCCNESCGICTAPGVGCISLFCEDAGAPLDTGTGTLCGGELCAPGVTCCMGCDGPYCGGGGLCPDPICPPEFCLDNRECGDSEYCRFQEGECGGEGECTARPMGCTADCPGACGCDGAMYCNECEAEAAGTTPTSLRRCEWEPPMGPCDFLSYCECTAQPGCEPLIDLQSGCVCPCEDPFNCTGIDCDCDCGGAAYIRCAPEGLCDEPTVDCGGEGIVGVDPTGCLSCGPVDG